MLVFVYGTLKKGCCNYSILKPLLTDEIPINVKTIKKYPMYKSNNSYFPYLENKPGIGHYIKGHLFEIKDSGVDTLDYFEGVPDLYVNGKIDVTCGKLEYKDIRVYYRADESDLEGRVLIDEWKEGCDGNYHSEVLGFDFDSYYKKILGESK